MCIAIPCPYRYRPKALTGRNCLLPVATRVFAASVYTNSVPFVLYSDCVIVILLELMLKRAFQCRRALLTSGCLLKDLRLSSQRCALLEPRLI